MYVFKTDEPVRIKNAKDADPEIIGAVFSEIAQKHDNHLRAHVVVDEARNPASPLHKHFEWDDAVAAEGYRLQQARALIRIVLVADDKDPEAMPTRAFFSIKDDKDGYSYRPRDVVVSSVELRLSLIRSARRDLRAFQERYRSIRELCEPFEEMMDALDKVETAASSSRSAA